MEDKRREMAERLLQIDDSGIVSAIYEKSFDLIKLELERHRRIVDKARGYLGMCLIILGIIVGIGNFFFKGQNGIPSSLTLAIMEMLLYISSIVCIYLSIIYYFKASFIHRYYWFSWDDISFIPKVDKDKELYYQKGQIVSIWDKMKSISTSNEKLDFIMSKASRFFIVSISFLVLLVIVTILVHIAN